VKSVLVLVDSVPGLHEELADALGLGCFDPVVVDAGQIAGIGPLEPGAVALCLLEGASLLASVDRLRENPELSGISLAAVVPAGDLATASAAWAAGVDEVIPWPDEDGGLVPRLRSLEEASRLRREVRAFDGLLGRVVTAFEGRAPVTFEHGARVGRLAVAMGRNLGLSLELCERMRRGALLHDIGCVVLPDQDPDPHGGPLPEALDGVRAHPVVGYTLLKGVPSLEPILPIVHRHHERIDGSGYPDGLRGSEIPLSVQVVAIADAFDSLTSLGPGRTALSCPEALGTIREEAGNGVWDLALVRSLELAVGARSGPQP